MAITYITLGCCIANVASDINHSLFVHVEVGSPEIIFFGVNDVDAFEIARLPVEEFVAPIQRVPDAHVDELLLGILK